MTAPDGLQGRDWLTALMGALQREAVIVRVVLAAVRGSAPREPGAGMLVGREKIEGSIGGGQLEWEALATARSMLGDAAVAARIERMVLGADLGQCCGGVVEVWMERYTRANLSLLRAASDAARRGAVVLVSTIRGQGVERRLVCRPGEGAVGDQLLDALHTQALPRVVRDAAGETTLLERLDDDLAPLWLYGAGHVGQALARILKELPLRLTWVDPRPGVFPAGSEEMALILNGADPVSTVAHAPAGVFFVVMTHSHPLDYALCRAILERGDFAWLGLIGSDSKAARFRSRLLREGLASALIARLTCPIGIGGITSKWPAAIAVAVAAQLMREVSAAAVVRNHAPRSPQAVEPCRAGDCAACGTVT